MKTDSLIDLLARQAGPASAEHPATRATRRLLPVALFGLLSSAVLALWIMGPIPAAMAWTAAPWIKAFYGLCLAGGAGALVVRLSRPAAALRRTPVPLVIALLTMGALGTMSYLGTPVEERQAAVWGHSALTCPWAIAGLALPALAASLFTLRRMAPTRLGLAGAAAGLFAGALGALGYALACTETAPTFIALWYTAGIGLSGLVGGLLGPKVLRW